MVQEREVNMNWLRFLACLLVLILAYGCSTPIETKETQSQPTASQPVTAATDTILPDVPTASPILTNTPVQTGAPDPCAGATNPGAKEKYSLEQIIPCLDTIPKVSEFMSNNMIRDDNWDAKACGQICYSPAWLVYQNGADDLHGLVTLECYFLEQNGWDAYHIGLSVESQVGTNICGVKSNGKFIILDADGKNIGTFDSLQEVADYYISIGAMQKGGFIRSIKPSQIEQLTTNETKPSLIELPWVVISQ